MIVTLMHVVYCLTLQITTGWTFFFKDKQVCFFLLWIGLCWFGGGNVVGWLVELELEHPQPHTGLPVPVCVRCARCVRCVRWVWVWTHCRYLRYKLQKGFEPLLVPTQVSYKYVLTHFRFLHNYVTNVFFMHFRCVQEQIEKKMRFNPIMVHPQIRIECVLTNFGFFTGKVRMYFDPESSYIYCVFYVNWLIDLILPCALTGGGEVRVTLLEWPQAVDIDYLTEWLSLEMAHYLTAFWNNVWSYYCSIQQLRGRVEWTSRRDRFPWVPRQLP